MNSLIYYFGILGKIALFSIILMVIIKSINNHGKPKIVEHNLSNTVIFNLIILMLYALSGILSTITVALIIVLIFHIADILESYFKNKFVEFTTYNAYKSIPIMIFYFMSLYLTNFWSPVLMF